MGVGVRPVTGGAWGAQPQLLRQIPPISEAGTPARYTVPFLYLISARKHLVTRHVFDNNLEHESGERTEVYLGAWAALKLLCCIGAIPTSQQKLPGLNREASLSSLGSLRLWWRNNFVKTLPKHINGKVTNGFWCKMGLVSIKSQSGMYWELCGVTKTDWLLHLAGICQLFSNRTVLQLLGM